MISAEPISWSAMMNRPLQRKVAVVTTSRADYSHLRWVLHDLREDPRFDLQLIVSGAHLADEFGRAADEVLADGHTIAESIECLVSSDSDVGMAKTIGLATLGFADALARLRPDLLLLIADRYEMLAPASVALALRIPIAHIEGGDISEGAIDDAVRNALTKMSHLHFTPTAAAAKRVAAMGEEPWRIHHAGAPSLDHLTRSELPGRESLEQALGLSIAADALLIAYHPVTLARDTLRETDALFAALESLPQQLLFCFPNADAGSRELVERTKSFVATRADSRVFVNLNPREYWALLSAVGAIVGNSSSGIMESPSLALPTVNVGMRQQGRERARNVIDAEPESSAIGAALKQALSTSFRDSLVGMHNPYGDGSASARIVGQLAECPLGEALLLKRAMSVRSTEVTR